jgi:CubicO group peptidase (beta-lactamase class C family)/N-acetylglutamate synthase-like GNAT family acetyltransferase
VDLESILADLLDRCGVPGAVVGVVDAEDAARVVTAGTRGDGRGSVDDDTVFAAASLSKPVFAYGVMSLVDAGALELDRPLTDYVAEPYLADDERAASITARMVLSHTTGFPNWREDGPLFLRWPPGTRWGYAGEGYAYLQHIVEQLTGVSLDRYMTDAVLGPLGMHDSSFARRDEDDARVAVGHDRDGNPRPPSSASRAKAAAGGMYTTGPDYLRFLVHSLAHCHRMFEPQVRVDDELAWGLGWGIEESDGPRAIWQWGNDPGFKNFVIGRPADRQGVVVFTNGDRGAFVYRDVVRRLLPGAHPSLETRHRPRWLLVTGGSPADLRPRLDEPAVRAVLEVLTQHGADGEVDRIADRYRDARTQLLGLVVEKSWEEQGTAPGTPIACVGLEPTDFRDEAEITSLAVLPEWRGQGFARALIFRACEQLSLRAVEAGADGDAVDFYRAIGFTLESLGEQRPGVERFRCRLELPSR